MNITGEFDPQTLQNGQQHVKKRGHVQEGEEKGYVARPSSSQL